jgi:hypothetical protein
MAVQSNTHGTYDTGGESEGDTASKIKYIAQNLISNQIGRPEGLLVESSRLWCKFPS